MKETKYVVIIQCDLAHRKCSGFACTNAFYNREDSFKKYNSLSKYISFTCGGCCGKSTSAKLSHFLKKIKKNTNIEKEEIKIHLSSCITTDNYHYDRCPHIEYLKNIISKRGFEVVEGTYISKNSTLKREKKVYKTY